MIYISNIKETFLDYPDDESLAVIAFFEGCTHNCINCQNKQLQKRNSQPLTLQECQKLIENRCKRNKTDKIVFSGGDPLFPNNLQDLRDMFKLISNLEEKNYHICVYTGFELEKIENLYKKFPEDFIRPSFFKCGKYLEKLKNKEMGKTDKTFILASTNQNFYKKVNNKYFCITDRGVLKF